MWRGKDKRSLNNKSGLFLFPLNLQVIKAQTHITTACNDTKCAVDPSPFLMIDMNSCSLVIGLKWIHVWVKKCQSSPNILDGKLIWSTSFAWLRWWQVPPSPNLKYDFMPEKCLMLFISAAAMLSKTHLGGKAAQTKSVLRVDDIGSVNHRDLGLMLLTVCFISLFTFILFPCFVSLSVCNWWDLSLKSQANNLCKF